ncbi:exopolyphosphatase [Billgrantia tianxiuensis]|jgi:exopolyphosphatase/guanosine-5'-triphosphate,3'-diphosphate pyrophosphatase|uniref:Exopolyphosphatase n=1 Tax=Billgrantia tianxiuensis TaxID=2497861 RepID=A0A6I6SJE8_9GAMM|nr:MULTISPECIES: exopolyphosphatase [Halomonas]MCE8033006.1 exopolyphosphatase [Halomonas sp. MCCC 1A11057]QHC48796.1 exopolyphosphatase [Halomonas tianxiuensis]
MTSPTERPQPADDTAILPQPPSPKRLAAIDLGSNSFHLLVAHYQDDRLQVVARRGEKVQLAAGLDAEGQLEEAAMQRALDCLARFAPFVADIPQGQLRVVGTNALRDARNSQTLIDRAESLLGHRIEIIGGREEARLIYLGAAHSLAENGRRLIIDIGGGSTEFIIGERFEPLALESLQLGCVTYTRRFFEGGEISEKRMRRAELSARSELANIRRPYCQLGWDDPVGSSGTIKAAASVIAAAGGAPDGLVTRAGLTRIRSDLIACGHLDRVALEGLKTDRARVFPAGVAILCAIFEAFDLDHLRYADGALREGVLYDMVGRNSPEDSRLKTLASLQQRHGVDMRQAENVALSAARLFAQVRTAWGLGDDQARFLEWAARLHEIGLAISHSQFHRHGAYLLEHSDLAGFSRPEQRLLAFLVRAHRRKFPLREWRALPESQQLCHARLARLLRLAVLLNHSRGEQPTETPRLEVIDGETLQLTLADGESDEALLHTDLEQEAAYQKAAGFSLNVT